MYIYKVKIKTALHVFFSRAQLTHGYLKYRFIPITDNFVLISHLLFTKVWKLFNMLGGSKVVNKPIKDVDCTNQGNAEF